MTTSWGGDVGGHGAGVYPPSGGHQDAEGDAGDDQNSESGEKGIERRLSLDTVSVADLTAG